MYSSRFLQVSHVPFKFGHYHIYYRWAWKQYVQQWDRLPAPEIEDGQRQQVQTEVPRGIVEKWRVSEQSVQLTGPSVERSGTGDRVGLRCGTFVASFYPSIKFTFTTWLDVEHQQYGQRPIWVQVWENRPCVALTWPRLIKGSSQMTKLRQHRNPITPSLSLRHLGRCWEIDLGGIYNMRQIYSTT